MATTLSFLRTAAKQRADQVNSSFLTDTEWNNNINASLQELYDVLTQKYGNDYFYSTQTITTDGVSDNFALSSNFYKLLGVDLQITSGTNPQRVTLRSFTFSERNRYAIPNFQTWFGVTNLRYRLRAGTLWFIPLPAANQTILVHYVPQLTTLVNDSDTLPAAIDGMGWEEYIVIDAAIKALQKEESDVSVLMAQKVAIEKRIEAAAENRDAGAPATISDTQWSNYGWPGSSGYTGGGGI